MKRLLLVLIALSGCVKSAEVLCSDGRLCPPGYTCDEANMRCLSTEQVAACSGREEGAECSVAGAPGACRSGACEPLICGDGTRSVGEACDGTDLGSATCKDAGYYEEAGLACTSFCTFDVTGCSGFCGDAIINGSELCDGGTLAGACMDYGFDAGSIACGVSCGLSFDGCSKFGWIAEPTTLTQAHTLDGTSASNIWVAGAATSGYAVAHYNGSTWTTKALAGDANPSAIAVTGAADVWIIRDSDGATPASIERLVSGTFAPVTGIPAGTYVDLWAAGPDAVYVATSDAGVLWWNGTIWQSLGTLATPIAKIDGTSSNDIWVVGTSGTLAHWAGTAWTSVAADMTVSAIDPVGVDDVWAIGASTVNPSAAAIGHWDGAQWTITLDPGLDPQQGSRFLDVAGSGANDAWVSETGGSARHLDGATWSPAGTVVVDAAYSFHELKTFPGIRIAITYDGFLYRYRGQMYARLTPQSSTPLIASVSFTPTNTVTIDISKFAYHFDGESWIKKTIDASTVAQGNGAIWGRAPNDIWVGGGSGRVYRYNGTTWVDTTANLGGQINAIVGFSESDVWLLGVGAYHYNGVTFEPTTIGNPPFQAASGSGPNNIWATTRDASGSQLWHYTGAAWISQSFATDLEAVITFAPDDVHVAGANRIYHWDGATWTEQVFPVLDPIVKLAGTGPDDIFALTQRQLMHFDGIRWSPLRPPSDMEAFNRPMANIAATRDRVDIVYGPGFGPAPFRRLLRTRLWNCQQTETVCDDGVDDDCDGSVDTLDTGCP